MADLYIRWASGGIGVWPITPCWPPNPVWTDVSIWMLYPPNHPDPSKRDMTAYAARIDAQCS